MLYGFFDESGIHAGAKVLAVGGWVGTQDEFESLSSHWNTALRKAGVEAFHFVDFNHSIKEFAGWTPRWKEEFLKSLFKVLSRRELIGVTGAILMDDFRGTISGTSGTILHERHGAYWVCLHYCIREISKRVSEEVMYVIDRQQEFDSSLCASFENLKTLRPDFAPKMRGITFSPKTEFPELQAADLLVGETAKSLQNWLYDQKRPLRKSFLALLKMRKRLVGGYYDGRSIEEMLAKMQQHAETGLRGVEFKQPLREA